MSPRFIGTPAVAVRQAQQPEAEMKMYYSELRRSYKKLQEENEELKESSLSSTFILDTSEIRSSAQEVEELYELLSQLHYSSQSLIEELSVSEEELQTLQKKLNHLKYANSMRDKTKSTKIKLVRIMQINETLGSKIEEIVIVKNEIKEIKHKALNVSGDTQTAEIAAQEIQELIQNASENADKDVLDVADLYEKVVLAKEMVNISKLKMQELKEIVEG